MSSFRQQVTAYRQGTVSTVNGYRQQTAETSFSIFASIQPVSPSDLESLPEGRRESKAFRLYSDDTLNAVGSKNPDQVVLFGERYEVYGVAPWQNNVINHNKYIVAKVLES